MANNSVVATPADQYDVAVIGAGPAGTTTAALLRAAGLEVAIFERDNFPRFVIGESLLPICNDVLREADLFDVVQARNYQIKDGAVFVKDDQRCELDFGEKFTKGSNWTWQVPRADFDHVLAREVERRGVSVFFGHSVSDVSVGSEPQLDVETHDGSVKSVRARFIVDASGYGRVLPRLLDLDQPSSQPDRQALFAHLSGDDRPSGKNAGRIYIIVHRTDVWFWIIPFSDGKTSVGVVAPVEYFEELPEDPSDCLWAAIASNRYASGRLANADFVSEPRCMRGYSASVKQLYGPGYCLVGNATEFLDPVFSSGIALALQSASRSANIIRRELAGESVNWETEYSDFMKSGIDTFRTFVNAWYDGRLADIFFTKPENERWKSMICSALAGYVWDQENPFVRETERKLEQVRRLIGVA